MSEIVFKPRSFGWGFLYSCFVCGVKRDDGGYLEATVNNELDGERVVAMFEKFGKKVEFDSQLMLVKINVCFIHNEKIRKLFNLTMKGIITEKIIEQAISL